MKRSKEAPMCTLEVTTNEPSINRILQYRKAPLLFYPVLTHDHFKRKNIHAVKYAGKLLVRAENTLPLNLKYTKQLWKLNIEPNQYNYYRYRGLLKAKKFVKVIKPFRKHLKVVHHDSASIPAQIFAHIRYLHELKLTQNCSVLTKRARFVTKIKSLVVSFRADPDDNGFSVKNLCKIVRVIASFRYLESLRVECQADGCKSMEQIALQLKALSEFCSSLKKFDLNMPTGALFSMKEVSSYVMNIQANTDDLQHLLDMKTDVFQHLSVLSEFKNAKTLNIVANIEHRPIFEQFLKYFTLPPKVESVMLNMNSVTLQNVAGKSAVKTCKNFPKFVREWNKIKTLKHFSLTTRHETYGSAFIIDIVTPILKEITNLESLNLTNLKTGKTGYYYNDEYIPPPRINPLDLEVLWEAVRPSEFCIKEISIKDVSINDKDFDLALNLLNKQARKVNIEGLILGDNDSFKTFMTKLYDVPQGKSLSAQADVKNVDYEILVAELLKCLKGPPLKGDVYLCIYNLTRKLDVKSEKQLKDNMEKKKILKFLKIMTKWETLLEIPKNRNLY